MPLKSKRRFKRQIRVEHRHPEQRSPPLFSRRLDDRGRFRGEHDVRVVAGRLVVPVRHDQAGAKESLLAAAISAYLPNDIGSATCPLIEYFMI